MAQKNKTKEELIQEIEFLQKRIAELETTDIESKQQQQQQQQQQQIIKRLATVVRDSNDAVMLKDFHGKITAWNHGAELMFGYSETEALRMNIRQLIPPNKETEYMEFISRLKMSETVSSFETQRVAKDGRVLDVWLTVTKVMDDAGKPIGVATTERDITERKQVAKALEESEARYKALFFSAAEGIVVADLETKQFLYANPAICRMFGYTEEELMRLGVADIHPKESLGHVLAEFEAQVRGKKTLALDLPCLRKDSTLFYADVNATVIVLGSRKCIVGFFTDITERKKAEEALRDNERKMRAIFDQAFQFIGLVTIDGVLIEANRSALELSGIETSSVLNKPFWETPWWTHSPELQEKLRQSVKRVARGEFIRFEATHVDKDGMLRYVDFSLKPVKDETGKVIFMIPEGRDITELKKASEELKRSQNMLIQSEKLASLGRIVAEIAHQVNNPLMIISSNAQLSLMSGPVSVESKDALELIVKECKRASDITHKILKFAEPSKGEIAEVDICKSTEAIVSIIEKQFKMAHIEIKRNYPGKSILLSIDDQLMQEVFMNLLNNAKEAMPDGGTITITASLERDFFRIDFKDTGCGMSEEAKQKIFEPFFTTKEKGTGLGLSICYGIIKAHRGELIFESQLNKGSTATVLLPLKREGG